MNKLKSLLLITSVIIIGITALNACKKKCTIAKEDVNTGSIISGDSIVVYPKSGSLTGYMNDTYPRFHIDSNHLYANSFEMSFDGGVTRIPVDYSIYNIVCYPTTVKCNASFVRDVTINHTQNTAIYTISATQCANGTCNEERIVENYVLVYAFPSSYSLIINADIIDAE